MIDEIVKKLNKKHLLIVGGNKEERQKIVNKIIIRANLQFFSFPKNRSSIVEYVDFVRKENLYQAWYSKKGKFGINQMLDFHWDWISENNSLVVLEEFQQMEQSWKIDLIRIYIEQLENRKKGDNLIRLIVSQENEENLIENLAAQIYVKDNERRTKRQVIEGSVEVVEL